MRGLDRHATKRRTPPVIAFTVHEPAEPARDPLKRAEDVVFVKEGFSWLALFVPHLWLIAQGMWLVLAGYVVLSLALTGLVMGLGANEEAATWANFALGLALAIQANDLRRWSLARRGYETVAAVYGGSRDECEIKYFAEIAAQPAKSRRPSSKAARRAKQQAAAPGPAPQPQGNPAT